MALASVRALFVRPTSAILPYRTRVIDAIHAVRELSVDAIVDGSFQRAGNRLRVTVQLIESQDGSSLWGNEAHDVARRCVRDARRSLSPHRRSAAGGAHALRGSIAGEGGSRPRRRVRGLPARASLASNRVARRSESGRRVVQEGARDRPAALRRDHDRALQQINLTIKNEKAFGHYHHAQYDIACCYAQLGELDLAVQWLTDAARNGFPCFGFFERDPLLIPIRSDERFRSLVASCREECGRYAVLYRELVG